MFYTWGGVAVGSLGLLFLFIFALAGFTISNDDDDDIPVDDTGDDEDFDPVSM